MSLGTIKLDKLSERGQVGVYKVSTEDYEGNNFYIEIDRKNRRLMFYLSDDFSKPVYTIDCTDKEQAVVAIPTVHKRAFYGALSKALSILDLNEFPDRVSYSA